MLFPIGATLPYLGVGTGPLGISCWVLVTNSIEDSRDFISDSWEILADMIENTRAPLMACLEAFKGVDPCSAECK